MSFEDFFQRVQALGSNNISFFLNQSSGNSRELTPENFIFFEETRRYLISASCAAVGKYAYLGGVFDSRGDNSQTIGHALDEKIIFLGKFLIWADELGLNVTGYELDFLSATHEEKNPERNQYTASMSSIASNLAAMYFIESYEKVKEEIRRTFDSGGWFNNWPDTFRFAYLIRNALAHNRLWRIDKKSGWEQYHCEVFEWQRAGLSIQMQSKEGDLIDEGQDVMKYLNGADFIVLLIEISDALLERRG